ncbi:MAG: hypothetical protein QHC67_04530 [Sphingobium sp.]|uniref:alginate O-acetyltransferase AlgX-related protein n=1 Tax=Sphingobium sp. TaxID=1912891 RepID=UPI0029B5EBCF|nr:hypothetical protein [Sphingobium sp.]MDX3909066.1 hypothetical protein [Sphingobium sp.]
MTASSDQQTNRYSAFMGIALLGFAATLAVLNPSTWIGSLAVPFTDGQWAGLYGKNFDKTLALTQPAKDAFGTLSYIGFREGRPGVLVGSDGWLFTDEEMARLDTPRVAFADKISFIRAAKAKAEAAGTQVIVALIPAKLRVYDDKAGRYGFMPKLAPVYTETVTNLQGRGVPVVDLLGPFVENRSKTQLFLRTDTHWTPQGAEIAAREVAKSVMKAGLLAGEPASGEFVLKEGSPKEHRGDLLAFLPLLDVAGPKAPAPDFIRTGEAVERPPAGTDAGDALLGEDTLPVALVGSSYSFDRRWQFEDQLKVALRTDILNAAQEGQGPFKPMADYLASAEFREKPPRLVIWEIPERYLWAAARMPRL